MKSTLIIAEAGVNHNGDIKKALELVKVAADAGADIVKFQTFNASLLATKSAKTADYQKDNLKSSGAKSEESQYEMLKRLELTKEDHFTLIQACKVAGIGFLSTAFDFESLEFIKSLKLGLWKIPSGEITNLPYLEKVGSLNQKIIVSTGMCDLQEVKAAVQVLMDSGTDRANITVLHCNTAYPTPVEDVNLSAMAALGHALSVKYGYSDHTLGIEVPIAAVALGATVIEKHFTLDRTLPGPDHAASLEPKELKEMIRCIRNIDAAMGRAEKEPTSSEIINRVAARKSLVAAAPIKKGELFTAKNITTSRPGSGISPMRWHEVIGTVSSRDYIPGDLL